MKSSIFEAGQLLFALAEKAQIKYGLVDFLAETVQIIALCERVDQFIWSSLAGYMSPLCKDMISEANSCVVVYIYTCGLPGGEILLVDLCLIACPLPFLSLIHI